MALWSSLLKWMIVGAVFVMFPWTMLVAVLYLAVKSGVLTRTLNLMRGLWKRGMVLDRMNDWRVRRCKSLDKESFELDYYLPSGASPYIIMLNGAGFLCISSFSIVERSKSPETYRKAVSEILKTFGGGARTISFVGTATDNGDFLNSLQIVSRHGPAIDAEFERAGIKQMELLEIAREVVNAISPTASIRIHRGKEIIRNPMVIQ